MVAGPIHFYPNEDIKVFNKHQVSDYLYTALLSMFGTKRIPIWFQINWNFFFNSLCVIQAEQFN